MTEVKVRNKTSLTEDDSKRIEELLIQSETVKNSLLKEALQEQAKREKEKAKEQLLYRFEHASNVLQSAVHELRVHREKERKLKSRVTALDKAFEEFKRTGDWDLYRKICMKITMEQPNK